LDQSHADLFACETIPSFAEAKVLAELLRESSKPAWISFSCKDGEHINDGTPIQECVAQFENHPTVFAVGVNCTHPKFISGLIKSIKNSSNDLKVIVYPNSGEVYIPDSKTWIGLDDPNSFAQLASEWISLGADIIGGCCRIGPSHILELQKVLAVNQGDQ
jgi:homocysteine S-methyltransferase